jgi:gamma-glutamylcysteine synthetase
VIDALVQLGLALFGLAALVMATGRSVRARRWAPLVGLCGQPWWIVFALDAKAWGLLALSAAYTAAYLRAAWLQWQDRGP